jgi:hypothetical protein
MIAAAWVVYDDVHVRPDAFADGKAVMLARVRARNRRRTLERIMIIAACALIILAVVAVAAASVAQAQTETPSATPQSTPTLVPATGSTTSPSQTLQIQEFTRELLYGVHPSTVITKTTSSGSTWLIERRFTYGEAAVVIVLMALLLVALLDIVIRVGLTR